MDDKKARKKMFNWIDSTRKKFSRGKNPYSYLIELFLVATQNNSIRSNYVKAKIAKTQQNTECRLCGDRDEGINHIICEKVYNTRHDCTGKWPAENCTRNLDLTIWTSGICTNQNLSRKMRCTNFSGILRLTDHRISANRQDLLIVNKKREPAE